MKYWAMSQNDCWGKVNRVTDGERAELLLETDYQEWMEWQFMKAPNFALSEWILLFALSLNPINRAVSHFH
jgi:hypothetical protein